jgi:hypothetical protein
VRRWRIAGELDALGVERARRGPSIYISKRPALARCLAPQIYPARPFTRIATAVSAAPEQKGEDDTSMQSAKALHGGMAS